MGWLFPRSCLRDGIASPVRRGHTSKDFLAGGILHLESAGHCCVVASRMVP